MQLNKNIILSSHRIKTLNVINVSINVYILFLTLLSIFQLSTNNKK